MRAGQKPDAREGPLLSTGLSVCRRISDVDFRTLIGKGVIELAAQQDAMVVRPQRQRELRCALRSPPAVGVRGKDLLAVYRVDSPFVTRGDVVRRRCVRRCVSMRRFTARVADLDIVGLHERRTGNTVPVRHSLVMFGGSVVATVLELNSGIPAKRHEVGKEETIR